MPEEKNKEGYTDNPFDVIEKEKAHLKLDARNNVSGLAISGGGIRSASFALGVMQALVDNNQLSKIDYMSTVSGGGYLGSALTWALNQVPGADTTKENFPLGKKNPATAKKESDQKTAPAKDENSLLNFIRQHASYLSPVKSLDMISFAAVVMRSMVMSLFVYLGIFTVLMTVSVWVIRAISGGTLVKAINSCASRMGLEYNITAKGIFLMAGIVIISLMIIMGFFYSLSTYSKKESITRLRYRSFIRGQITLGKMLKFSFVCFVLATLPFVSGLIDDAVKMVTTASTSTLSGIAVGIWQYLKARKKEKNTGASSDILIYLGASVFFYGVLLFSYILATKFFLGDCQSGFDYRPTCFLILAGLSLIFGYFVNLNFLGPHYIWRNRLMEAFMPDAEAVADNKWKAATRANGGLMKDMCDVNKNPRPYHIVNTNVILSNSKTVEYSGRGGDNFIISPLYCGSAATGWKTTETYQTKSTRGITLASAMATSAAALNPNAGVSGEGVTRNVMVSVLLSMLNLRLGYWASNPDREDTLSSPNFISPGLTSEIFRNGFTEHNSNLLLSDGGHYENLGLYELIRRKLSLIIVSDGGADPLFNFDDLANAVEKVRVDFGAKICFTEPWATGGILPNTLDKTLFQKKYEIAERGYAIAEIVYNDGSKGKLVYIKLAMIEELPTDVYSYKGINKAFPHQPTSDQFFDEKQFEAYRELGYYSTKKMMSSDEGKLLFY